MSVLISHSSKWFIQVACFMEATVQNPEVFSLYIVWKKTPSNSHIWETRTRDFFCIFSWKWLKTINLLSKQLRINFLLNRLIVAALETHFKNRVTWCRDASLPWSQLNLDCVGGPEHSGKTNWRAEVQIKIHSPNKPKHKHKLWHRHLQLRPWTDLSVWYCCSHVL